MKRIVLLFVAGSMVLGACEAATELSAAPIAIPKESPIGEAPPTSSENEATERPLKVFNNAFEESKRRVRRAIRDLKNVGLWPRLISRRLYVIEIQSREGVGRVPDDKHLADASLQGYIDADGSGGRCYILFYPVAIERDLVVQQQGYDLGYWVEPPSLRRFWAAILAHELAHCLKWDGGEPFAEKWEARALEVMAEAGIP